MSLILTLALLFPTAFTQTEQGSFRSTVNVTAIDLIAEVRNAEGQTPRDLKPADFSVLEDGVEQPVVGVEYLTSQARQHPSEGGERPVAERPSWQIVLYFDATFSSYAGLRATARSLAEQAEKLAALGTVEIVVADPSPRRVMTETGELQQIRNELLRLSKTLNGRDWLALHRRDAARTGQGTPGPSADPGRAPRGGEVATRLTIRPSAAEEAERLSRFRTDLVEWMENYERRVPRVLFVVTDGFDVNPAEFYETLVAVSERPSLHAELQQFNSGAAVERLGQVLSAGSWTTIALTGGIKATFVGDASTQGGRAVTASASAQQRPVDLLIHPRDPLNMFAEATGGSVLADYRRIDQTLTKLGERLKITYQVSRVVDARVRRIEIRSRRPGLEVRSFLWAASSTLEEVAAGRARRLLRGDPSSGELPVKASLKMDGSRVGKRRHGTIEAIADVSSLRPMSAQLHATSVRVTVAVEMPDGLPFISHHIVKDYDLAIHDTLVYGAPVEFPRRTKSISVVIEDLTTGAWGGTRIAFPEDGLASPTTVLEEPRSTSITAAGNVAVASTGDEISIAAPGPEQAPASRWYTDWSLASAQARADRKMIFAFLTTSKHGCIKCYELQKEMEHPAIQRLLRDVIPLRLELLAGSALVVKIGSKPQFALLDSFGTVHSRWPLVDATGVAQLLVSVRRASPDFLLAAERLREGRREEGFYFLGHAHLKGGNPREALDRYREALNHARAAKNESFARSIEIQIAFVEAVLGTQSTAIEQLQAIAARSGQEQHRAEAWIAIGRVQELRRDRNKAIEAYGRAAEIAPAGSPQRHTALTLLGLQTGSDAAIVASKSIQIISPLQRPLGGSTPFETHIRRPDIERVDFFVDDQKVATVDSPPFSANLPIAEPPREQTVRVVATGAGGREIGRDSTVINDRNDEFWIHVARPLKPATDGSIPLHIEVNVPSNQKLESVEIFRNDEKMVTLTEAPFSYVIGPPAKTQGFVRTVATLEGGMVAEDALLLGQDRFGEEIRVRAVELFTSALDRKGRPVLDLKPSDFTILEEGVRQQIESFEFQPGGPLTLGLAVDSSGSISPIMLDIKKTAVDFLERVVGAGDKAFLVEFDATPRLVQPTTTDLKLLTDRILEMTPDGPTALYDAVVFALLQFQGVQGRKALLILSDGEDLNSRYDFQTAMKMAQQSGVVVYAIVMGQSVFHDAFRIRRDLGYLTHQTGGEDFYLVGTAELGEIYRRIDSELRNQYLLTYHPKGESGQRSWKTVRVKSKRAGITTRTKAGYYSGQ